MIGGCPVSPEGPTLFNQSRVATRACSLWRFVKSLTLARPQLCFLQTPGKLYFRMANVILMYETADEAYHQGWGSVAIPASVLARIAGGVCSLA
jgi:hypothetical protein